MTDPRSLMRARLTAVSAALGAAAASMVALAPAAGAHSPTDFLKVPVGRPATVLLPPIARPPGHIELAISTPDSYLLAAASAGPGWQARVAPHMAVLDGSSAAGASVLATITGTAQRAGRFSIAVRVSSPDTATQLFHWPVTALAGYSQPVAAAVGAAQPDVPVALAPGHSTRLWPVTLVLILAALAVLVVPPRRRQVGLRSSGLRS